MQALFLGGENHPYLAAFDSAWLAGMQLYFGEGEEQQFHYLPALEDGMFDYVFVPAKWLENAGCHSFANWLRVLKSGGTLFFEHNAAHSAKLEGGLLYLSPFAAGVEPYSNHSLLLRKKDTLPDLNALLRQGLQHESAGLQAQAQYFYMLAQTAYPGDLAAAQCLSTFYRRTGQIACDRLFLQNFGYQKNLPGIHLFRALAMMTAGDYQQGFRLREDYAAKYLPNTRRSHAFAPPAESVVKKRWQGEDLKGKTFVVWSEFGLGDELMFAELAHFFKRKLGVGRLVWVVQPPLVDLLRTHSDIDEVVSAATAAQTLTDFDYWDFPYSLLSRVDVPFTDIPRPVPYVAADSQKILSFADDVQTGKKYRVGLAWRGSSNVEHDHIRSIHDVNVLDALVDIPDVEWFCLHKDLNEQEKLWLKQKNIRSFSEQLNDFTDTAALMAQMDCIVSTDTSVIHVAGALNLPAILMLAATYDWRWGLPGQQNMWYPSVRTVFPPTPLSVWPETLLLVRQQLIGLLQAA